MYNYNVSLLLAKTSIPQLNHCSLQIVIHNRTESCADNNTKAIQLHRITTNYLEHLVQALRVLSHTTVHMDRHAK